MNVDAGYRSPPVSAGFGDAFVKLTEQALAYEFPAHHEFDREPRPAAHQSRSARHAFALYGCGANHAASGVCRGARWRDGFRSVSLTHRLGLTIWRSASVPKLLRWTGRDHALLDGTTRRRLLVHMQTYWQPLARVVSTSIAVFRRRSLMTLWTSSGCSASSTAYRIC
jgi:hypothetical protein